MNQAKPGMLVTAFACATLLFTKSIIAEDKPVKQKNIYKVEFNNPEAQTKALSHIQNQINAVDTEDMAIKVILFGKGYALVIKPGITKNTRLSYTSTDKNLQAKISELENKGVKFIICEPPSNITKNNIEKNIYKTSKNNTTTDAELSRLKALGYKCIKP